MNGKPIRVFIVDDSQYMRYVLKNILKEDPEIEVVGEARDGVDALMKISALQPDVVTLDVEMPRMDGLQTLRKIMELHPVPVLMVSRYTQSGGEITIEALESGAIDFVQKPDGRDALTMNKVKEELLEKIRVAAGIKPAIPGAVKAPKIQLAPPPENKWKTQPGAMRKIVVIGSSTGGPKALAEVLCRLPAGIPAGILVVQHMPPGFTTSLAKRLDQLSQIAVAEAHEDDFVTPGKALIAPGDYHMKVATNGKIHLSQDPPVNNIRPSVDVTLRDAAAAYGKKVICVILTGMGNDGTAGGTLVKEMGGVTIAQLGSTCIVNGMPASLVNAGMADRIVALDRIAEEIISLV
jgi:two-component system, chemotaxis family, protein-glutamate methylesterase/glutaminase